MTKEIPRNQLTKAAETLLSVLEFRDAELSLVITDDVEIAALNKDYRNKAVPTDVLSFPLHVPGEAALHGMLGDVVISWQTARAQAAEQRISIQEEFLRLLIHGTLHLCGYDHEDVSAEEERAMQDKEDWCFQELSARCFQKPPQLS